MNATPTLLLSIALTLCFLAFSMLGEPMLGAACLVGALIVGNA